jgi:hypothetical protein
MTTAAPSVEPATEKRVARLFGLTGNAWMRHANPLSVWSRFSCVSLIAVAVWSRTWIGWYAVPAVAAALAWTWGNPRLFAVPSSTRSWASRGVLGERVYAERATTPIPEAFVSPVPNIANAISIVGLAMAVYGLIAFAVWPVVAGIAIVHTAKLWYIDRMVLLFDDVKQRDPRAASWEFGS